MPAAPDPPRWKETGHWRLQARARRGLTEAKAGRGAEDGQEDPCALSSAPPAGLPTQPPWVRRGAFSAAGSRATGEEAGRPLRLRGAVPLLPASRPPLSTPPPLLRASTAFPRCPAASLRSLSSSSGAPAQLGSPRTEALGAPRTRGTRAAPGQPPAGAPSHPLPRAGRAPLPRAWVPGAQGRASSRRPAGGPRGRASPAVARRWRTRSAPARTRSPPPPAPSQRTSPPAAAASPTTGSSSAPCPASSSWPRS